MRKLLITLFTIVTLQANFFKALFLPAYLTTEAVKQEEKINERDFFPLKIFEFKKDLKKIRREPSKSVYLQYPYIKEAGFLVYYDCKKKIPQAVAYPLWRELVKKEHSRKEYTFRKDLKCGANPSDYRRFLNGKFNRYYDRGHNAEYASFDFDRKIEKETFLMSNIAPQAKWLNRKYWAKVERSSRYLAVKYGKIYVMTGNCGIKGYLKNKVVIPKWWWKVIYIPKIEKVIAFLAPNKNEGMKEAPIKKYITTVEHIKEICHF